MKTIKSWQKFEYWDPNDDYEPDPTWEDENIKDLTGNYKDIRDTIQHLIKEEQNRSKYSEKGHYLQPSKRDEKKEEDTNAYYFLEVLDKNVNEFFTDKNKIGVYGYNTSEHHFVKKYIDTMYPNSWTDSNDDEPIYYEIHKVKTPILKIMRIFAEEFVCEDCQEREEYGSNWGYLGLDYMLVEDDKVFQKYYKLNRQLPVYIIDLLYKNQLKEETANSLYWISRLLTAQETTKQQIDVIIKAYQQYNINEETSKIFAGMFDDDAALLIDILSDDEIMRMSVEELTQLAAQLKNFKGN